MDHHGIFYALPQELPYFSHLNFVKWTGKKAPLKNWFLQIGGKRYAYAST